MTARLLEGKVILVVGASTGIGADAARVFARDGASVVLAARTEPGLRAVADELTVEGTPVAWVTGDASVAADAAHFVDTALERFGRLDGAFNNAGVTGSGKLHEVSEEDFDRIMAVNVKGVWLCMREEVRAMRAAGGGSIVNVSSVGGIRGSTGMGAYQATKHAVIGLTRTAAHDNGPEGIRVNSIAPGPIETPMLQKTREAIPGGVEARISATPLRKAGSTTEVADAAAWLLSNRASHISGIVLPVDGGFSS
ncbi:MULTISPECIES: SDR family NAD(P)-dependent oxidoreductase [unclassified Arthrobacter]|uniref:SDR family NAD(P)-dependent oxidoreductase n=1 Tax=unclassified Arthrobacter TaxID=235627 RepID=UPI001D15BFDD|nr:MULTISPECIES: SDR family NAD(P)-dependent oxidoreductase [unclassified Arthrobacter]MCC3274535.1 SDR family oxidoreductase [Arthrobacter sp. zg-Y20]MCC9177875.1 SDR family oxidoreductase [Arthrobacter sp. zg-Y750]MDK1314692.1 SDR family NAD(P)-dependent oxidoreductase [Arthrobacter sp. zg.Y20]WIB07672.1 SDR family NAD(P)-dependent oxidoreductase [Arthrobacter sp. zg-Y20]